MSDIPLEVELINKVRTCRKCKWFWGGIPPYGDFPTFDWLEEFPEKIRTQQQTTTPYEVKTGLKCKAVGPGQIDPGVMHGCRKAPIMTIGINPNMTSFYVSKNGARWSYPKFSSDARYAYYYRHHNVYQESLDLDFIKTSIRTDTAIVAKKNGWLLNVERSSDHRWVKFDIHYEDETKPQTIERAWLPTQRFVIVSDSSREVDPDNFDFKAGETIAGNIDGLEAELVQSYENATGYYQRYVHVLEKFKSMVSGPLKNAKLSISEDVAQHDMIACASPGWSEQYDIPRDQITSNCVVDQAFLVEQLVQTRPAVIVIVGGSTLAMFLDALAPFIQNGNFYDKNDQLKETYQLMKETVERETLLNISIAGLQFKSRLVLSPHFSYRDNFVKHSRFSQQAWEAFKSDFPDDTEILYGESRVQRNTWNNIIPVRHEGVDDEVKEKMSVAAWNLLQAYYYDPITLLANVLIQELDRKRLAYDPTHKRLERSEGGCRFCVNDLWKFPEGCAYKKDKDPADDPDLLKQVVSEIINKSRPNSESS